MDDINNHDYELPEYDISSDRIPQAILEDVSDQHYRVTFKPNDAGIVVEQPRLVDKQELTRLYPQVIEAWESKLRDIAETANAQEHAFVDLAGQVLDHQSSKSSKMPLHRGVDCDQKLHPGMAQHWGELRKCETHPPSRPACRVCKGCRVAHYALESREFDRKGVMARGARVPVCTSCAKKMVAEHGEGQRGCFCDSRWTCFRCREIELARLAKAREGYVEGRCGACEKGGELVQHVGFCLYCRKCRVYAESMGKE